MAVYQTPESKKEEYRRYLEKSGVIDALTKVLVGLYEETVCILKYELSVVVSYELKMFNNI